MPASAIVIKEIKPQRFNDRAFKKAIQDAAKEAAKGMEKDFKKTTATWQHKVTFTKIVSVMPDVEILVGTDDQIYTYVNDGTGLYGPKKKKYPIFAGIYTGKSNKKALSFQWGGPGSYRAKTSPGKIGSTAGGPSGPMVAFPYVEHPGIKPRKFDITIQEKWESRFKRQMEKAMSKAAKASGHGR